VVCGAGLEGGAAMTQQIEEATFSVDDRGDRVQFYCTKSWDIVGEIDREAGENACSSVWYGGAEVKKWAIENGYPEVADMPEA
jgi:hypothetical protein